MMSRSFGRRVLLAAALAATACWAADSSSGPATTVPTSVGAMPGDPELATRLTLAESLLYAHRHAAAAAEFEKVLARDPASVRARLGLARALFWDGRTEEAMQALEPAITEATDPVVLELWQEILAASGRPVDALAAIARTIERSPDDAVLRRAQARMQVNLGCFGPAITTLQALRDRSPEDAEIALDLAHALFTADRYVEAVALCAPYLEQNTAVGARARLIAARSEMKARRFDRAVELLEQIVREDPVEPRAWFGLLSAWILDAPHLNVDFKACLAALERDEVRRRVIHRTETREWLWPVIGDLVARPWTDDRRRLARSLARLVAELNSPAGKLAAEALDGYLEKGAAGADPDVDALVEAVRAKQVERGPLLEACDLLLTLYAGSQLTKLADAMLDHYAGDIAAGLFRAEALAVTGTYEDAADAYKAVLDVLPICTKARRGLARNYSWARDFERADETYRELIDLDPTDNIIRLEAARSLGWDKRIDASLKAYKAASERLGDAPAQTQWSRRLSLEHDAKQAWWWTRTRKALKTYKELIDQEPADMEARFDLAQVYAANRHWEEAAEQYNEILNIDARHRRARDALYKNGVYHHPELTTRFVWSKESGRGELADIETLSLTEWLKQEIARRTDFSVINTQFWHSFEFFGGGRIWENLTAFRLDHQFDMNTRGHIMSGWTKVGSSDDPTRWVAEAELAHHLTDCLELTVGATRRPWRKNRATMEQGIDENRLYVRLFSDVNPWLDLWTEYGHSWIEGGRFKPGPTDRRRDLPDPYTPPDREAPVDGLDRLITKHNEMNELIWGATWRFTLFPRILYTQYRGVAWWFDEEVPTYFSPDNFITHYWRLAWRHYLNNDQYVEQKQLYYEVGMTGSLDSDGMGGIGYDAEAGWDICHHFGVAARWESTYSRVYKANILWVQIVMRF